MNLPNKLTVTRLVLAPIFFIVFNIPIWLPASRILSIICASLALVLFVVMELTDLLDGKIARSRGLVTDLGKVMDPFADTLCHLTYFVCLMSVGVMPTWAFIIIMWREFSISFLRMLMMGKGKAVAANIWGKSKTVLYAVTSVLGMIMYALLNFTPNASYLPACQVVMTVLFALAAAASVASFLTYVKFILKDGSLSGMTR